MRPRFVSTRDQGRVSNVSGVPLTSRTGGVHSSGATAPEAEPVGWWWCAPVRLYLPTGFTFMAAPQSHRRTPRAGGAAKLFSWVKYLSAQFSVPRSSKYMNKKENLQSERDSESEGGGSHRETDAELQNTPIMGRAVSLQREQETQSDRLCGAGLRPRK
mgnify:CR=1 FL=1